MPSLELNLFEHEKKRTKKSKIEYEVGKIPPYPRPTPVHYNQIISTYCRQIPEKVVKKNLKKPNTSFKVNQKIEHTIISIFPGVSTLSFSLYTTAGLHKQKQSLREIILPPSNLVERCERDTGKNERFTEDVVEQRTTCHEWKTRIPVRQLSFIAFYFVIH